ARQLPGDAGTSRRPQISTAAVPVVGTGTAFSAAVHPALFDGDVPPRNTLSNCVRARRHTGGIAGRVDRGPGHNPHAGRLRARRTRDPLAADAFALNVARQERLSAAGVGEGWGEGYPVPFHKS